MKNSDDHKCRVFKSSDQPPHIVDEYKCSNHKCDALSSYLLVKDENTISYEDDTDDK